MGDREEGYFGSFSERFRSDEGEGIPHDEVSSDAFDLAIAKMVEEGYTPSEAANIFIHHNYMSYEYSRFDLLLNTYFQSLLTKMKGDNSHHLGMEKIKEMCLDEMRSKGGPQKTDKELLEEFKALVAEMLSNYTRWHLNPREILEAVETIGLIDDSDFQIVEDMPEVKPGIAEGLYFEFDISPIKNTFKQLKDRALFTKKDAAGLAKIIFEQHAINDAVMAIEEIVAEEFKARIEDHDNKWLGAYAISGFLLENKADMAYLINEIMKLKVDQIEQLGKFLKSYAVTYERISEVIQKAKDLLDELAASSNEITQLCDVLLDTIETMISHRRSSYIDLDKEYDFKDILMEAQKIVTVKIDTIKQILEYIYGPMGLAGEFRGYLNRIGDLSSGFVFRSALMHFTTVGVRFNEIEEWIDKTSNQQYFSRKNVKSIIPNSLSGSVLNDKLSRLVAKAGISGERATSSELYTFDFHKGRSRYSYSFGLSDVFDTELKKALGGGSDPARFFFKDMDAFFKKVKEEVVSNVYGRANLIQRVEQYVEEKIYSNIGAV